MCVDTCLLIKPKKKSYNFSVQIQRRYSENSFLDRVKRATIKEEVTAKMIDSMLGKSIDDDDIVILQETVKMSLKCPVSLKRMKMPVRGVNCKHIDVT